ncbi:hypothetical protein [Psychrobacter urativorans]|uniref:endonuclease/exonuclease/phosphatase family protein n=1 Tax=Psychrobacter urativorans TaxID=45610 RepID=UPI002A0A6FCB|nr:hypothetical protein [Psychrobacter urativorans]
MNSSLLYYGVQILAGLIAFVTAWSWLPLDNWWVRSIDFPRIQILVLGIIAWLGMLLFWQQWELGQWLLFIALCVTLIFQLRMVLPYTKIWKKEVQSAKDRPEGGAHQLKIMVSNVLTPNDETQKLVNLVNQKQPDILVTLESDQKWQNALSSIEPDYPYTVKVPLDNLYGMHLYSQLELIEPTVN